MRKVLCLILTVALAVCFTSCGDDADEPGGGSPAADVRYPTLPAGHKRLASVKKTFKNGSVATAEVTYDSDGHLLEVSMEMPYSGGSTTESVRLVYSNGTIVHKLGWQTTTYTFKTNSDGCITEIANSRGISLANCSYAGGRLQSLATTTSSTSYSTVFRWNDADNVESVVSHSVARTDSTTLLYNASVPNAASIDVIGLGHSPFGNLVELVLRSEGLFGATGALLPRTFLIGNNSYLDDEGKMKLLHCVADYTMNADGSPASMRLTVPRGDDNEQLGNVEPYTLEFTYK